MYFDRAYFLSPMLLLMLSTVVFATTYRDEARDRSIAKHVMSVHINASGVNAGAQEGDIDIATMKKFVSYCRLKCAPRLSETAATMLSSQVRRYVVLRRRFCYCVRRIRFSSLVFVLSTCSQPQRLLCWCLYLTLLLGDRSHKKVLNIVRKARNAALAMVSASREFVAVYACSGKARR